MVAEFNDTNECGITVNAMNQGGYNDIRDKMNASLATGDLLAFELMTYCEDGGLYHLLAVQFFESRTGTATLDGATIFTDDDFECPAGPEDGPPGGD